MRALIGTAGKSAFLASIKALQEFPAVNAEIDGTDIIYKNYYNIGVAVGTPQGLVVPVIRDAGGMNLAEVESKITITTSMRPPSSFRSTAVASSKLAT